MANNRIYLRCNECGEMLYLGKSFLQGYYWVNYGKENGDPNSPPLEDRLNEFFHKHTYCGDNGSDGDYSIEYEFPIDSVARKVVPCNACKHYVFSIQNGRSDYCNLWSCQVDFEGYCWKGEPTE